MNNYSLGGFDPSLVEQIYNYVQPSPFATSAMRDPSLVGQTSEMLTRLSYPNDKLAPPTYSDVSMPSGQPEHDTLDVIGAIFKAPFRLIGAAKNGLEEAIGHPNADKRAMQDEFIRQRKLAILASNSLQPWEKQRYFPEEYAQDRQAMALAQTGGDARATGRDTGDYPLPQPRQTGVAEWFFGDAQKQRASDLAKIKAFEAEIAQRLEEEKYRTQRMTTYKTGEEGFAAHELGRLRGNQANEVHPTAVAQRGLLAGQTAQAYAGANMNNAGARAHQALADQRNAMTSPMVDKERALADKARVDATTALIFGPQLAQGDVNVKQSIVDANNGLAYDRVEQGKTRGPLAASQIYENTAQGDAATRTSGAKADEIYELLPTRNAALRSQVDLNNARIGTEGARGRMIDTRIADMRDTAPARLDILRARADQTRSGIDLNVLRGMTESERANYMRERTASERDLLPYKQGVMAGQIDKLDAQTSAVAALANAGLAKIQAQTQGLIGGQALTEAKMRLMEIQGGVMQTREERAAAMDQVKQLLMQTRMELATRAQNNADSTTVAKIRQIDADIERLGSVVDLNNARAGDVGTSSGGLGGGGWGKALLAQAGRENAQDTKTLLTIMNDDFGDVYRTANGLDMLGKVRGKDYVINEPGWIASKFGNKKPSIEFPEGSSLRGVLDQYRNEAPARRFLANEGPVAATDPAAIPGQGPGQVSGETLTLLMDHGYGKLSPDDVAKSIDRAYQDEQISEGQARSAFEFLGAQRKR